MTELNNYFFVSFGNPNNLIIPSESKCVFSLAYFDEANSLKLTNPIVCVDQNTAKTKFDETYTLLEMHPDYSEYVEARKNNIPVIKTWLLSGNLRHGYILVGEDNDNNFVEGKVISQENNYVRLLNNKSEIIQYFVNWRSCGDEKFKTAKRYKKDYLDFDLTEDFEFFAGLKCKPILFPNNN